jgi:hypothetical protein
MNRRELSLNAVSDLDEAVVEVEADEAGVDADVRLVRLDEHLLHDVVCVRARVVTARPPRQRPRRRWRWRNEEKRRKPCRGSYILGCQAIVSYGTSTVMRHTSVVPDL